MRIKTRISLAMLALAWTVCAQAAGPVRSQLSNKCLDVPGGNMRPGVELVMWECHGGPNQQYDLTSAGELRIGGLCVVPLGGQGRSGERIGLATCNGDVNQKWRAVWSELRGPNNRCLDLENGNTANGARVLLWDCHTGPNQRWSVPAMTVATGTPVPPAPPRTNPPVTTPPAPVAPAPSPAPPPTAMPTPTPPRPEQPAPQAPPYRFAQVPPAFASAASELRQFSETARNVAEGARQVQDVPEVGEAAAFLSAAASLADLFADPNRVAALTGVRDPAVLDWTTRVVARATEQALRDPEVVAGLRSFQDEAWRLVAMISPEAVVPAVPWHLRSVALVSDDLLLMPPVDSYRQRIDWQRLDRVERLITTIQLGMLWKQTQAAVAWINKVNGTIEQAVGEIPGLEEMPFPLLQAALKAVSMVSLVTEISGQLFEGFGAFMPARIAELYVRVDNQDRRPDSPPILLERGRTVPLEVYITWQSYGGQLETPWTLIEFVADKVFKSKRVQGVLERAKARLIGEGKAREAAVLADQLKNAVKEQKRREHPTLVSKLEEQVRANSGALAGTGKSIYEYLKSKAPKFPIAVRKGAANVNSDKVLTIRSNSPAALQIGQKSGQEFEMRALSPSPRAGFHAGLKPALIERFVRVPGNASPNMLGNVEIVDRKPTPPSKNGRPCGPGGIGLCALGVCTIADAVLPDNTECR